MTHKSLEISNGYNRLMSVLALPLLVRREYRKEQGSQHRVETHSGEPIFPIWPDIPWLEKNPQERIQSDLARFHQSTFLSNLR